ncbi:MAG: transglutaminase domain-containing protein [Spirochaetaceae bacterium]|nr:MAG: transglutaminase domain-containing protein [Spirochaetaceae bacterium]
MSDKLSFWIRAVLAAVAAVLLPVILKLILRAELSWILLVLLVFGKIALAIPSARLRGLPARACRILSILYTLGFAAVVLTGILITPYSAYGIWFESVQDGESRGVVSILIVLLAAVFSSALAGRFLRSPFLLPLYGQLLIAGGLLSLVYQIRPFYILLLCLLTLGTLVLSLRFVAQTNRLRNLAAFFLLFLALLALSWLPMLIAEPRGSRIVDQQLHPGLRQTVVAVFPRFPLLYGIPGFGYGFESKRLGGTPILSDAPIFEIQGQPGQRLYLRTAAYTTYDGQSWGKREEADSSVGMDDDTREGAGADEQSKLVPLSPGEIPSSSVRITLLTEYYTLLPFTLNTRSIHLPEEQIEGISGSFEQGYLLAEPLRSDQSIYLQYGQRLRDSGTEAPVLSAETANSYLELPNRLSPELTALARQLTDPSSDTRSTLRNIERYLAQNYTYNLEAERTPIGADFVDTFLFQHREGYCVHFASSFVILARLNGIPSRYATGFLAALPGGSPPFEDVRQPGLGTVSGLSSHAWPEVWLKDRGWTAWEATTAVNPSYYEEMGEDLLYEYGRVGNRLTNRQLRAILGREPLSREQTTSWSWGFNWQIFLLAIPALALLFIALLAIRRYGILVRVSLRPDRRSAMKVIAKIASAFHRQGVAFPDTLGWVRWARGACRDAPHLEPYVSRLLVVVQRLVYSNRSFRRRDLHYLRTFYLRFCAAIR